MLGASTEKRVASTHQHPQKIASTHQWVLLGASTFSGPDLYAGCFCSELGLSHHGGGVVGVVRGGLVFSVVWHTSMVCYHTTLSNSGANRRSCSA